MPFYSWYTGVFDRELLVATPIVSAVGDTTVLTPPSGRRLEIHWVAAMSDPDDALTPLITVRFAGGSELYSNHVLQHREIFTGAVNEALVVNLDELADVALTIHYREV